MNFVRTILIILAVYFAFKLIGRYVLPWLARKATHKMQQKMQDEMRRRSGQQPLRKEGEVTIEYTNESKKRKKPSSNASRVGEYVDYEEVD